MMGDVVGSFKVLHGFKIFCKHGWVAGPPRLFLKSGTNRCNIRSLELPKGFMGWIILHMLNRRLLGQFSTIKSGCLIMIFFAYAPGVFKESFWSDDYPALMDTPSFVQHVLRDARPTAAGLFALSFSLLSGPANAWILRSLALVALLLIFLFISNRVNNSKYGSIGIFSIAIAFCLPSFQMYIHWSTTWFFLWSTLAGLYSFHFWISKIMVRKIMAIFLLILALTIYPPTALFFFSAIIVINTLNEFKFSKTISEVRQGLILLVISGLFSILVAVLALQISGVSANKRVSILTLSEIPQKIAWLLTRPLVVGLRPFMIDSPSPKIALITSIPVIVLLLFGIGSQSRHLGESLVYRAFWSAVPLVLSLIPIMITSDNQIEFRVLPGYCWGIAVLATYFLLLFIDSLLGTHIRNIKQKTSVSLLVATIVALIGIVSINSHYSDLIGSPYQKKNAFLNSKISSCLSRGSISEVFIIAPKLPFPSLPRLGIFSMSTDLASGWVPKPNVDLLLKERGIRTTAQYLEIRPQDGHKLATGCVIDLEEFRKSLI